jgi:1-deoxy-D-xylulose-5-phosphate reductoisomerase
MLNAANEVAVEAFLNGVIAFSEIPEIVKSVLDSHTPQETVTLEDILNADRLARDKARELSGSKMVRAKA